MQGFKAEITQKTRSNLISIRYEKKVCQISAVFSVTLITELFYLQLFKVKTLYIDHYLYILNMTYSWPLKYVC